MNVVFVTHAFPRAVGDAAGSFVLRLARALADLDVTATVLTPHAPGLAEQEIIQDVAVRRFRYAPERYETLAYAGTMAEQVQSSWAARLALGGLIASALGAVLRAGKHVRPRVLHAHWWFPSGLAAAAAATLRGLPLITTLHGSDVRLARRVPGARSLYARVAARSTIVTAVSGWLATQARALAPEAPDPRVAPMPADVALFSPGGTRAPDRLLFVGRLTPQKGLGLLLRAMCHVPPSISLDVVGDGPQAGPLRELSTQLGLAARVRWHGSKPPRALAPLYQSATAVVVPSVDEGLGLVAVEAQLCEAPVVAFDSGGLRDVVADNETGILARSATAEALAAAVNAVLQRSDRGAALGRAGRVRAVEQFAPEFAARRYATIYEEAISHFDDRKG